MVTSRSRLSSNFKQLRMLSHRNGIVLLYFLFTLLYSIANLKYKDLVRKQLKGALNAKAVNASDGAAKMFLRNLYKKRTGRNSNYSYSRNHSFCARNRYDILFNIYILKKYCLLVVVG